MTKVSFYKGLRTIGGTFVAVETDSTRCVFDFGFAVDKRCDPKINIREASITEDYVRTGMLPAVDGMYDRISSDVLGLLSKEDYNKETFMLMSHMHIDHMGGIGLMHTDIPVYMSNDSLKLYKELIRCKDIQFKPHYNCIGMADGEEITKGDIKVKLIPVDHDIIGAAGYLITTPDGSIVYTGDYRFHGYYPEKTENFAKQVSGADVFITESVTISFEDIDMSAVFEPEEHKRTEYDLLNEMKELVKEVNENNTEFNGRKLIVINPYNRNVERIKNLIEIFNEMGRTLVLEPVQAVYVKAFYPKINLSVYDNITKSEHKELLDNVEYVTREDIINNPSVYVLQLDYENMYEIYDLASVTAAYEHMDGVPLGDYDPSYEAMAAILDSLSIKYENRSLGGHAEPYYLKHMADTVAPCVLVPLHGFRPEQFISSKAKRRLLPNENEVFELRNHDLVKL